MLIAIVALVAPTRGASAQASRDTTVLRPVVVSATLAPIAAADTPASVTVIDGAALRAAGITQLSDALRTVPGVTIVQGGSVGAATSLFMRGGNSNFTKVLVDGVPVNAPGGAIDLAHLSIDDVARIEVVRGPASVIYGSDAVSGVVQIVTRRGAGAARGSLALRAGSFGAREGSAEAAGGDSTFGWSLAAGARRTDGMLAFNNSYRNTTGALATHYARGATRAQATVRLVDARYHYPTDGSGQVVDSNAVRDEGRTIIGASVTRDLGTRIIARLALSSSDFDGRSTNDPDSPADTTGFSHDHARVARRGGDARISLRLTPAALLTTGIAFEDQRVSDRGASQYMRFPATATSFREHRTDRAVYAELLGDGEGRASYALGARLDDNSSYGSFGTARLAAGFRVGPSTRVHAAFGTAFREPAFDEAFSTSYTIGNRALEPERTRSWEAGVDQRVFADRIELGARWFDQRFRDMIQYVSGGAETNYLGTYGNLAGANASGLELEARLARYGWLDATTSLTLLRTRVSEAGTGAFGAFEAGERLLRRPARQGAIEIGIHAPAGFVARASLQLTGERDDYDFTNGRRVTLDAYRRLDLGGEYRIRRAPIALTMRVDNVTGTRYEPILHFPAPGRVVIFGARVGR